MTTPIRLVQNDTGPSIILNLKDHVTGVPIDLTGMINAVMLWRAVNTTTLLTTTGLSLVAYGPTINGQLLLTWGTTALAHPEGYYEGQIKLNFPSSIQITIFTPLQVFIEASF